MTENSENTPFRKLVKTRNFGLFWGAGALSGIGDHFDLIAFPWLVLLVTGDPLAVGAVIAVGSLPTIIFMLLGGALVDRLSPRIVMLGSNSVRIVLSSMLAALILTGFTNLWLIYLFALLKGIADSLYHPGHAAMLPQIVPAGNLRQSNALIRTTADLSGFVGPALAGALIAFFSGGVFSEGRAGTIGIGLAFVVVAFAFLISSLLLILMRTERTEHELAEEGSEEQDTLSSILEGIRFARSEGAIFIVFLLVAGVEFLIEGPVIVGIPVLADTYLSEGALALGVITAGFAGGSILGAVLAGAIPAPRRGLGPIFVTLFGLSGILLMPFGVLRAMWVAAGVAFFVGIIGAYVDVLLLTWLQRRTPRAMMGRVMSFMSIAEVGLLPISIAVAGALITLSLEWVFIGAGALIAIFCLLIGFRREIYEMRLVDDSR